MRTWFADYMGGEVLRRGLLGRWHLRDWSVEVMQNFPDRWETPSRGPRQSCLVKGNMPGERDH